MWVWWKPKPPVLVQAQATKTTCTPRAHATAPLLHGASAEAYCFDTGFCDTRRSPGLYEIQRVVFAASERGGEGAGRGG